MKPMTEAEFLTSLGISPNMERMRESLTEHFRRLEWHDAVSIISTQWPEEYSEIDF